MLKARVTLEEFIENRQLATISKETGIKYMTLWQVAKGNRYPTYIVIKKLKSYIDVNDWFTEE